jgi:hypothetical protein
MFIRHVLASLFKGRKVDQEIYSAPLSVLGTSMMRTLTMRQLDRKTKSDLCLLARNQGLKVSVRIQGQGSRDLSKDAIICKIMKKTYVDQTIAIAIPQINAANVTIHDNFRLINVMFMDETIEMSISVAALPQELNLIQARLVQILHFGFMWHQSSTALVQMETQTWKA